MIKFKTIIIDDEAIARNRMAGLLAEFEGRFDLIGTARNGREGLDLINSLRPDLIFLDIEMPVMNGFEMLNQLAYLPRVVFCTAYEQYALQAFNTMALDYLVKPVEKERLALTLDKLDATINQENPLDVAELLALVRQQAPKQVLQSIPHKMGDRVLLIKVDDISYFQAEDKYVSFFTYDGASYLTDWSLKKLLERLPDHFLQVHRGIIVNTRSIFEFRRYFRGAYVLILNDKKNTRVETGRSFSAAVKRLIEME